MTESTAPRPAIVYVASSAWVFLSFFMEPLRAISERGFDVIVACPPDGPVERFEAAGFTHVPIPMGRTANPAVAAATWVLLTTLFIERRPVLVHSHTTTVHLIAALAARAVGVPLCVATIHGHFHTGLEAVLPTPAARALIPACEAYYRAVGQRVDAYLVINRTERDMAMGLVPEGRLELIEGGVGVELGRFNGASGKREARRRLRLPEGQRQLGFIGRLLDHKARDLLALIDRVQGEEPNVGVVLTLLMDGDPALEEGVAARVASGRQIVVLRDRAAEEMPLIYRALDVLALPSLREGASTVLMEAAAMRVPVACYDIAGTRDLVEHGHTGLMAPAGDLDALADATLTLLRSPGRRRDMGAAARAMAERRFDRGQIQQRVFSLYDRLFAPLRDA